MDSNACNSLVIIVTKPLLALLQWLWKKAHMNGQSRLEHGMASNAYSCAARANMAAPLFEEKQEQTTPLGIIQEKLSVHPSSPLA